MSKGMSADFSNWMAAAQEQVEATLGNLLPSAEHTPHRLHEAMRYATLGGGKRVRPLLTLAAGELVGGSPSALLHIGCAVELIHVYSLVHDDLPSMDNDALRRGRPTCHVQYDEATALLVGDALQTEAFALLCSQHLSLTATQKLRLIELLSHASGSRGMAGGQAIDLGSVGQQLTQPELELMHALKTGALIRAAILMGASAGDDLPSVQFGLLDHFSRHAGLLFQVVDDILDCTADSSTLGKTAGKDAAQNKPTYVSLLGLAGAKELAENLHHETRHTLNSLGERSHRLRQLTDFIAQRDF